MMMWWSQSGSNRRPSACKADALPAELWPHKADKGGPVPMILEIAFVKRQIGAEEGIRTLIFSLEG